MVYLEHCILIYCAYEQLDDIEIVSLHDLGYRTLNRDLVASIANIDYRCPKRGLAVGDVIVGHTFDLAHKRTISIIGKDRHYDVSERAFLLWLQKVSLIDRGLGNVDAIPQCQANIFWFASTLLSRIKSKMAEKV